LFRNKFSPTVSGDAPFQGETQTEKPNWWLLRIKQTRPLHYISNGPFMLCAIGGRCYIIEVVFHACLSIWGLVAKSSNK